MGLISFIIPIAHFTPIGYCEKNDNVGTILETLLDSNIKDPIIPSKSIVDIDISDIND